MERFQETRETAKKKVQLADHILSTTYPLVKDQKLLVVVLENIFLALTNAMGSSLYYERLFKRIPPFQNTFSSKFNMFTAKIVPKHGIEKKYPIMMQEIKEMIIKQRKSPTTFQKEDRLVFTSDDHQMESISVKKLQTYLIDTKSFLQEMEDITKKEEEIFQK